MSSRAIALVLADVAALVALRPDPELLRHARHPRAWLSAVGPDAALAEAASAALWCAAAWVAIGLGAVAAAHLPGGIGRLGARLAARTLPAALRRIVAGTAGLGVLLAPAAAGAWPVAESAGAPDPAGTACSVSAVAGLDATPGPDWPGDGKATNPGPGWPAGSRATPSGDTAAAARVTVRPGDSLWLIATHRLGPGASDARTAGYWPQLYRANRDVVGDDPDLVRPGQVLDLPAPTSKESP